MDTGSQNNKAFENRLWIVALVAAAVARLILMFAADGHLIDDSYITLRYGQNFVLGHGLVFNPGEHVYSAPALYAVWLGFLWKTAQIFGTTENVGYWVTTGNISFTVLALWLFGRLMVFRESFIAKTPLLVLAFYLPFLDNGTNGMETSLFVLIMAASLWLRERGQLGIAAFVLGLSLLVRAEGFLWIGSVLLFELLTGGYRKLLRYAPLLIVPAVWAVISILYYDTLIPHNVMAKSGWYEGHYASQGVVAQLWSVLKLFSILPWGQGLPSGLRIGLSVATAASVGLLLVGCGAAWRTRDLRLVFGIFTIGMTCFYVAGRGATWASWYAIPPGFAWAVVGTLGIQTLLPKLFQSFRMRPRWILATGLLVAIVSIGGWFQIRYGYYEQLETSHGNVGRFLNENCGPNDRVLLLEIGYIGYLCERHVYDSAGIVSPKILDIMRTAPRDELVSLQLIEEFDPDYVVEKGTFLKSVRDAGVIGFEQQYERVFRSSWYHVFARKTATD